MNGAQLRTYLQRRGVTPNWFQERTVAAYQRLGGANGKSALRNVKRWFSLEAMDREIRPSATYREAVREAIGDDPFEAPTPWELRDRLEELEARVRTAEHERLRLLEVLVAAGIEFQESGEAPRSSPGGPGPRQANH